MFVSKIIKHNLEKKYLTLFFVALGNKPRASHMLGKWFTMHYTLKPGMNDYFWCWGLSL
jgi:hypothetical protein